MSSLNCTRRLTSRASGLRLNSSHLSRTTRRHLHQHLANSKQYSPTYIIRRQPLATIVLPTCRPFSCHSPLRSSSIDSTASSPDTLYHLFPKTLPNGPPPASPFKIDLSSLKREFLQLQAQAHPDKHPPHLKTRAEATSSHINTAYKTLQNPLLRAQYLLSLRDINVAEDETAKVEDPELLMTVLEIREAIEDAQDEGELSDMIVENDARIEQSEEILETCFEKSDIQGAKAEAVRLRYWINVRESLSNWEKGVPIVLQH